VATETASKATILHQRLMHELKEFVILAVYLYITLGAVILMKTAALHAEGVAFEPLGIAAVKALVLAKFMLIGNAMKFGERHTGPLIWPTLHKSFAFLLLLMVLTIVEEIVVGLFHGRSMSASLGELVGPKLGETLASCLIMLLVLLPWFGFRVLDDRLGGGTLARMFFRDPAPMGRERRASGSPHA
jgi:hypothetical protein